MLNKPVLFVLGAGAHMGLGMPGGADLIKIISGKTKRPNIDNFYLGIVEQLARDESIQSAPERQNSFPRLCWDINQSLPYFASVDDFLESKQSDDPALEKLVKSFIVYEIRRAERKCAFHQEHDGTVSLIDNVGRIKRVNKDADFWMLDLFKILSKGITRDNLENIFNNLQIMNFNYDRCFELFMTMCLMETYGIERREAVNLVNAIEHMRPYGQVAPFEGGVLADDDPARIVELSNNIKTLSEGADEAYRDWVDTHLPECAMAVFLGFGFHIQNTKLLTEKTLECTYEHIAISHMGISKKDIEFILDSELNGTFFNNTDHLESHQYVLREGSCSELLNDITLRLRYL